jgi:hypothetical protein
MNGAVRSFHHMSSWCTLRQLTMNVPPCRVEATFNVRKKTCQIILRLEVHQLMKTKIMIFWDVMPASVVHKYRHFGVTRCLHLQGVIKPWWWKQHARHNVGTHVPNHQPRTIIHVRGAPKHGLPDCSPPPPKPQNLNLKNRFCRYYDIKSCTWFTLQPKSATEISWWLSHQNCEK